MSERSSQPCVHCVRERNAAAPLLAVLAVAGLTTAAVLLARRLRATSVGQSAEDLLARCDDAAKKLDKRMSSASGYSLAG